MQCSGWGKGGNLSVCRHAPGSVEQGRWNYGKRGHYARVRDCSLVIGRGGGYKTEGVEQVKFYPYKKGVGQNGGKGNRFRCSFDQRT